MEEPGTTPSLEGTTPISITNKPNKSLALKLNKILGASASEDARVKAALTALADIPDLEEADLKRNLRGTIEKKEIETNKKFLEGFSHVIERLEILEAEMDHMDQICTEMRQKLDAASAETANMVEQAHALQEKSAACNTRLIIADKLLEKFTLSDEEIRRLCSSTVPVDEEFFVALDHLQQIYHDCRLLLMTQNQQAGMQIMESMALHQETAYEKLYRWTQHESRSAFGNDSIDVSTLMTRALVALRHRPVLFQTILDELAVARREAVARAFINALTRGGPGGTPRPIELQAHDSLRYIGDMLAWIHQACASEKEMLESLFQKTPTRIGSEVTDEELAGSRPSIQIEDVIDDLLETAMEGTCRPLKSRMEQVLILQPGAITSYRVANLIQFYAITIGKLLRKNAGLSKVLYDITDMAYKYFFKTLSGQGERLLQCGDPPAKDLAVTSVVRDMTLQLKEILSSYDSSLIVATSNTDQMPEFNIGETLDAIVDPLVHMCETSVQKRSKIEQEIYLVNCMQHILTALAPFFFTKHKQQTLTDRINVLLHELALEQYQVLLKQSGLFQIDEALRSKDPEIPLSSVAQMDARSLSAAMAHFDSFLILASSDVSPQLRSLNLSQHYQQVQDEAIRLLLDAYRRIYQAVEDPKNEYENPTSIMPRTVEEMEAIFSFAL